MKKRSFYQIQLTKTLQYIDEHLQEDISVKQLAIVSNFSLFHFQRLFKAMMNESPYDFIKRLRLEKSIFLLQHHPHLKIETVAFQCGFNSIENFSRQFKSKFEFTPTEFKSNPVLQKSRIYQEPSACDFYLAYEKGRELEMPDFEVKIEVLEKTKIAFVRAVFGADGSGLVEAYQKLMTWGESEKYFKNGIRRFGMSIDNPEVTPANKYRYDFAIEVPAGAKPEGIFEIGEIPKTRFATLHCQGDINKVAQAWDFLYKKWLPENDFVPMHYPAIEEFVKGPEEIGWGNFDIKCRIPLIE